MRRNKKKKIIIISLIGILILMTVGYAAFNTNLEIKGTSKINSNWNVLITNVTKSNVTGTAEETKAPTWDNLTAYMEADLFEKGDSIEYDVTVENRGTIDAALKNITENIKTTNEAVKITFSGYTKGEKLYKNTTKTIKVKIEYNPEFEGKAEEGSGETSITLDYTQAEGGMTPTNQYLVTYNCTENGGKDCSSYNEYLNEGDTVNLSKTTEKEGYTFIGWNTNKEATEGLTSLQLLNQDVTLYAIFKENETPKYTITYNYNGATGGNTETSKTIEQNKPYGDLPTPTKSFTVTYNYNGATSGNSISNATTNYTFNGWYKEETFDTKIESADIYNLNESSTIYAKWTSSTITLPTPTKTGYIFDGWYSDQSLTNKVGNGEETYTLSSNITLYAKWSDTEKPTISLSPSSQSTYVKSKAVTVTLSDEGSGLSASQNIYYAWSTSNTTAPSYSSYVTTTNTAGASSTTVTIPSSSNSSLTGTYYLWIKAGTLSDVAGNTSLEKTSSAFKFDNNRPTISLSPNSQSTYVKSKAVTVNLSDSHSGLSASQNIYYAWSTSNTTAPSYNSYVTTTNTAGASSTSVTVPATSNSSLTGTYYLWIKSGTATDVAGNTSNQVVSSAFKFDNTAPTISLNPNTQTTYVKSKAVTVTLSDSHSGLPASQNIYYAWSTSNTTAPSYSSYVTTTNSAGATSTTVTVPATSNSSLTGSYYLWIKAGTLKDTLGHTNAVKTSAVFKFDNTAPTGSIAFTGSKEGNVYVTGTSYGTVPYATGSSSDGHSGVKSTSLSCTSSNTDIATVSNTGTKTNITIKSRKTNGDHYSTAASTINCTLTITDNVGNTKTVTSSTLASNGWLGGSNLSCSKSGTYKNWYFVDALNKITGWGYIYSVINSTTKASIYYYFDSNGLMTRGWQKVNGTWYYLNDFCTYRVSYKTSSNYDYPDGGMVFSDTLIRVSDNAKWTFNSSGACTSGSGC